MMLFNRTPNITKVNINNIVNTPAIIEAIKTTRRLLGFIFVFPFPQ